MEELFGRHVQKQLSKASPTPLYHQLYTVLKTMVIDGTLELGARMPTEEQLAELFSVSRITATRAMEEAKGRMSFIVTRPNRCTLRLPECCKKSRAWRAIHLQRF